MHVFDSATGQVYDAEDSGKEDLICRNCQRVLSEDDAEDAVVIEAMLAVWATYMDDAPEPGPALAPPAEAVYA